MTEYYRDKLDAGLEYQDFIADILRRDHGIYVGTYSSKRYQMQKGESASGIEIKLDTNIRKFGNLYIETAEKSDASVAEYTESGVRRDDGTWLYLIGDYREAWLFSKRQLRDLCAQSSEYLKKRGIRRVIKPTSIGYLVPVSWVMSSSILLRHFRFADKRGEA